MAQFKNIERRDANQPDDLVTVRLLEDGLYGDKAKGDTIDLPARTARHLVDAKLASAHDEEAADPLEVRIDNHLSNHDAARVSNPEVSGQAGLAALDRIAGPNKGLSQGDMVNGRMFRDSQDAAEARLERGDYSEAQERIDKVVKAQDDAVAERKEAAKAAGVSVPAEERSSQDSTYTDQPKESGAKSKKNS